MEFTKVLAEGLNRVLSQGQDFSKLLVEVLTRQGATQAEGLGNREKYVGASDLNQCIRQAVLGKFRQRSLDIKTALYFVRGHLAELIVTLAMDEMGLQHENQAELIHPEKSYLRAHTDFLFVRPKRVHVLEVKSGKVPNDTELWEPQLYTQMGLAALMYPGRQVTGSILSIDLTAAEFRVFNGFQHDPERFDACVKKADLMWRVMNGAGDPDDYAGMSYLCSFCSELPTCPRFSGEDLVDVPDLQDLVDRYWSEKMVFDQAKGAFEATKGELLEVAKGFGRKVKVGDNAVKASKRTRTGGIDTAKLKKEMPDVHEAFKKEDRTFYVLDVSPVNKVRKKRAKIAA